MDLNNAVGFYIGFLTGALFMMIMYRLNRKRKYMDDRISKLK